MRSVPLAALLALTACASAGAHVGVRDCAPAASGTAAAGSVPPGALAGTFRLVQVLTSSPVERAEDGVTRATVRLTVADSVQRAESRVRRIGHLPRADLRLVGTVRWPATDRDDPAEVDGAVLYLGCRDCMDGSPDVLLIRAVDDHGFVGTWRDYQTGIGQLVDRRTGKPAPDPAGYFCARRE